MAAAANADRTRKLLVRASLVSSATIATLVGAQNLAMLDTRQIMLTQTANAQNGVAVNVTDPGAPAAAQHTIIKQAPPAIVILRHPGDAAKFKPAPNTGAAPAAPAASNIEPPAPSEVEAPPAQVVVVQPDQPQQQKTRSSR